MYTNFVWGCMYPNLKLTLYILDFMMKSTLGYTKLLFFNLGCTDLISLKMTTQNNDNFTNKKHLIYLNKIIKMIEDTGFS